MAGERDLSLVTHLFGGCAGLVDSGTGFSSQSSERTVPTVPILGDRVQRVRQLPDLQCPQIADNILSPWRRLLPARH